MAVRSIRRLNDRIRGAHTNQIYAQKREKYNQYSLTFSAVERVCVYLNAGIERGIQLNVRCGLRGVNGAGRAGLYRFTKRGQ